MNAKIFAVAVVMFALGCGNAAYKGAQIAVSLGGKLVAEALKESSDVTDKGDSFNISSPIVGWDEMGKYQIRSREICVYSSFIQDGKLFKNYVVIAEEKIKEGVAIILLAIHKKKGEKTINEFTKSKEGVESLLIQYNKLTPPEPADKSSPPPSLDKVSR